MKASTFLVFLMIPVILVGCIPVQNKLEASQVTTTPTSEVQIGISHEAAVCFFDLVPGESKQLAIYQGLKASGIEFRDPQMWSRGMWFMHIPVSNDKEIYIECAPDVEVRGEGTALMISYQLRDKGINGWHYSTNAAHFEGSLQEKVYVKLEQFSKIIPGESTVEDITNIANQAGLQDCSMRKSTYGWQMILPVDEENVIVVEFDSNYTVVSYTYRVADIARWEDENINSRIREDGSIIPIDEVGNMRNDSVVPTDES